MITAAALPTVNLKQELCRIILNHVGHSMAITSRELSVITGYPDRAIRLVIRDLIAEGMPIASSTEPPMGYFIASTWEEANHYADTVKGRLIEDAKRRRDFRRSAALYLQVGRQDRLL